ncbi:unnamed protein product [Prorocentrum cordatum]|uniref:Acyltransferase 3 domain-containing protein n=1 Tax=Prorocentrum cordatum TaxID=2364126 RepID=A0ABN9R6M1_9DINO|nr:unnamed protein product [Polarella glacialis]
MAEGQDRSARLDHLTGARALCAIWIVCCHFVPPEPAGPLAAARNRGNAGVCFFVVLSGFITQEVGLRREGRGGRRAGPRLPRPAGVPGPADHLGGYVLRAAGGPGAAPGEGAPAPGWRLPGAVLPARGAVGRPLPLVPQRPDVDGRGAAALLAPLPPDVPRAGRRRAAGRGGRAAAAGRAPLVRVRRAAAGALPAPGHVGHGRPSMWGYIWPPSQLADFAVGAACAALARRCSAAGLPHGRCGVVAHAALADASAVVAAALVLAVPSGGEREGWEALFSHGLTPLYAAFLFGSCARGSAGLAASLLSHGALVGLGEYSLEAYLFQWPMHEVFVALGDVTGAFSMRQRVNDNACGFLAFAVCLWIFSAAYAEFVEAPLVRWLRGPGDDAAGQRTSYGLLGAQTPTQAERGGEAAAAG